MKRTLCILCALLAVLLPLSACQPTPEEDVVVNKGEGTMEAAVAAPAAAPYRYEAPERWVETFTARDQTVRIDAGVEVPDDEYHPVLLVERRSFDAQQAVDYIAERFLDRALPEADKPLLEEKRRQFRRSRHIPKQFPPKSPLTAGG